MRQKKSVLRAAWVLGVLLAALALPPLVLAGLQHRGLECPYRKAQREANSLEADLQAALKLRQCKRAVVAELLAGQMTLAAAAERFRVLSEAAPRFPVKAVRKSFPAASAQESWCRCVMSCVRHDMLGRGHVDSDCLVRLEAEFAKLATQWPGE